VQTGVVCEPLESWQGLGPECIIMDLYFVEKGRHFLGMGVFVWWIGKTY